MQGPVVALRDKALDDAGDYLVQASEVDRLEDAVALTRAAMNASAVALNCARIEQTDANRGRWR